MGNTEKEIKKRIEKAKPKKIFFTEDFRGFGTPASVKTALHRLVKKRILHRLGRGIYTKPGYSKLIGKEALPSLEEIAAAIAKRDKVRIIPTGSMALHLLGLSTQIPMKIVYLTEGTPRKIKIGNSDILFRSTTPKNLSYRGEICTLVIQALKEIGKGYLTAEEKDKLISVLKTEDYNKLKYDIAIAPQWISEILAEALPV